MTLRPVVGVGGDRLDLDVLLGRPGEVAQLAAGVADHDDRVRPLAGQAGLPHRGTGGSARGDHHANGGSGSGTGRLGHDGLLKR